MEGNQVNEAQVARFSAYSPRGTKEKPGQQLKVVCFCLGDLFSDILDRTKLNSITWHDCRRFLVFRRRVYFVQVYCLFPYSFACVRVCGRSKAELDSRRRRKIRKGYYPRQRESGRRGGRGSLHVYVEDIVIS